MHRTMICVSLFICLTLIVCNTEGAITVPGTNCIVNLSAWTLSKLGPSNEKHNASVGTVEGDNFIGDFDENGNPNLRVAYDLWVNPDNNHPEPVETDPPIPPFITAITYNVSILYVNSEGVEQEIINAEIGYDEQTTAVEQATNITGYQPGGNILVADSTNEPIRYDPDVFFNALPSGRLIITVTCTKCGGTATIDRLVFYRHTNITRVILVSFDNVSNPGNDLAVGDNFTVSVGFTPRDWVNSYNIYTDVIDKVRVSINGPAPSTIYQATNPPNKITSDQYQIATGGANPSAKAWGKMQDEGGYVTDTEDLVFQ